ncbi:hypothetical protein CLA01_12470 [Chryseobacterium lathyri]|uniref:Uncharacterized protein n=1 Tax=Chryseobacterium lathyri TaxID=395933 RepID=A0A511Y7M5_9FLAO|nr:hypothetical protein CLA01_12470 [Chryseobacterium lathyri]
MITLGNLFVSHGFGFKCSDGQTRHYCDSEAANSIRYLSDCKSITLKTYKSIGCDIKGAKKHKDSR